MFQSYKLDPCSTLEHQTWSNNQSQHVLLYSGVSLSISLHLKLAPVPYATPKWPIHCLWFNNVKPLYDAYTTYLSASSTVSAHRHPSQRGGGSQGRSRLFAVKYGPGKKNGN